MGYKLGSLFDGSGGFPLAGSLCGITPVWAAEVEPYPIAVTRSRFPGMRHLGDISKVNGAEIEPVDIITFGSPCQDLSMAGKRAGLKHADNGDDETTRSGLFMEAVRIIKEMRASTNGVYPRFALWENVPGAFSSNKGADFHTVLQELVQIVEPAASVPGVPKGGWPYADSYCGGGWSIGWRTFDAQYWGVPQRRRRIHLVLDLGGECAREVLFEREGLRGYFAACGASWQGAAPAAENCAGADDRAGEGDGVVGLDIYNLATTGDVAASLTTATGQGASNTGPSVMVRMPSDAIPINTMLATRHKQLGRGTGFGVGEPGEPQFTISAAHCHAVAYAAGFKGGQGAKAGGIGYAEEVSPSLMGTASGTNQVPCVVYDARGNGDGQTVNTITGDHNNRITDYTTVVAYVDTTHADDVARVDAVTAPLQARDSKGGKLVQTGYIVRRITPTECARLQGFPDKWGHPDAKDDFTDEEYRFWLEVRNTHATINGKATKDYTKAQMLTWYNKLHTDSAEYKMWGNGIALPPALYCMQGIVDALGNE